MNPTHDVLPIQIPWKAFGIVSAIAIMTASGQISTIIMDEHGAGFHNGAAVPAGFQPDPFNGNIPCFAYTFPFGRFHLGQQ